MAVLSPLSGAESRWLFSHKVLGTHVANFYLDEQAGFVFAHDPSWLEEAYSSAISMTDTGCLSRNIQNVKSISHVMRRSRRLEDRGVDLGGGYGLFVRGMRDAGLHFHWSDRYSENLLARGFEARQERYEIATAFELLEHLENPIEFLRESRRIYNFDTLFFSATCLDQNDIPDANWWYWSFETGQHISFFSLRSLEWMASKLEMELWHVSGDIFAFSLAPWDCEQTPRKQRSLPFRIVRRMQRKLKAALDETTETGPDSLTFTDHLELVQRLRWQKTELDGNPDTTSAEQAS